MSLEPAWDYDRWETLVASFHSYIEVVRKHLDWPSRVHVLLSPCSVYRYAIPQASVPSDY
jgi:hypothetical protein